MDMLRKLLTVLLFTYDIYTESEASSCQEIGKPENQTIQVCRDQILTSDRIYIDSDGAPDGNSITCWCTLKRSTPAELNVNIRSHITRFDGVGIKFRIPTVDQEYNTIANRTDIQFVLENTTSIVFSKTKTGTKTAICLALVAGGFSVPVIVQCHEHELVAKSTAKKETNSASSSSGLPSTDKSSTIEETESIRTTSNQPYTGSSIPLPVDHSNVKKDSLPTVMIAGIVIGVAVLVVFAIVAAVILVRKRRRKKGHTSDSKPNDTSDNMTHQDESNYYTRENPRYESADGSHVNNRSEPAEQQRLLKTNATVDNANDYTYAEIQTLGKQSSSEEPHNDNKICETEAVYNTVGAPDSTHIETENVYNTAGSCIEGVYNTLNETLDAKIASENVYGAASGAVS